MTEVTLEDMWTPYKYLHHVVERSLAKPAKASLPQLDMLLRKYKQNFANIMRNPPKNSKNRAQIKQGITEGLSIPGSGHIVLSKELVDESIILSDMYDLDEYVALELLCTAQQQMAHHPGLPRGLVAVLLYYDGRKALACTLRDLFQARNGVAWCSETLKEVTHLVTSFTDSLVADSNILNRIIDLLGELDISKEMEILTTNRALGSPKHHRQVLDLFEDIRLALATALFNWSAQCGLPSVTTGKLLDYLSRHKPTEPRGGIDDVTATLLMAVLYAFDTSILQRYEDGDENVQNLPIITESGYAQYVFESLRGEWMWDEKLKSIVCFGFGLAMASLRQAPQNLQQNSVKIIDKDEHLIDEAIQNHVFDFIYYYLLENEIIFKREFFFRRIHVLFTDFIELMHSKVTELRGRADETARTVQCFVQQGLDPPQCLDHNFENLMLAVGKLYENDKLGLDLCMDYWGPIDIPTNYLKTPTKSVSLFKFIRLAGELLPPILFVPYLKMLTGLSNCEKSARNAFNLLKQGSGLVGSTTLSWDHFFASLARYYTNLRQEQHPISDTIYRNRVLNRCISPQEIEGLHAVLGIIRTVSYHDDVARVALCEHPNWVPLQILLGLLSCSVPLSLKANILKTLASLGKSKETAIHLWNNLEASQIITTIPTTTTYASGGLEAEIEQNESRSETYPLSQAILDILYTLFNTAIPKNLGAGPRKPGLDPYVTFVIDKIFLRFYNRNYKRPAEKWEVGEKCLKLLHCFVKSYEVNPTDFIENKEENSPPGYHVLQQMHTKSETLRLILHIIDEARLLLDVYTPFPGKKKLEDCAFFCLNILERSLLLQDLYFDAQSIANSSSLLSGLNKLLMDLNPRSGRPDYVLNTTKFVTYNNWLPEHALLAVKILTIMSRQPNISSQILRMFTVNEKIQIEIRHGFVECLESDFCVTNLENGYAFNEEIEFNIKEAIINLFYECLTQPAPNIAHYLLGFDIMKDSRITQLQKPGVMDFPSNCSKSLVLLLDKNLEFQKNGISNDIMQERIVNKAYELLYALCFNQHTSEVFLRFLRSCNDFLCRHISALPFKNYENAQVLYQMSFLLKCIAIELKTTSANNQVSQFAHLCKILLGVIHNNVQDNIPMELSHYSNPMGELLIGETSMIKKKSQQVSKILICHLLDCLEFEPVSLSVPKWDFFDNSLTDQILKECEIKEGNHPNLINIKKLHDVLQEELNTVQSTIATGQRHLILEEIESVLTYALKVNDQKSKLAATIKFMEAWGQVAEILFCVTPAFALSPETKHELLIEILQCLISKVVPRQVVLELANLSSGSTLLFLVNLRCCYNQNIAPNESDKLFSTFAGSYPQANVFSFSGKHFISSPKSHTLSLKYILKNIVEWIITSGVSSQKLRVHLYTSLLNCLHILNGRVGEKLNRSEDEQYVSLLDRSIATINNSDGVEINLMQMAIEVLASFGDKLIDILCHDSTGGHDISKMLALSCINALLDVDSFRAFINFIAKRGYLSHIINSLLKSDDNLCRVLKNSPDNMRSLYVYESKMAMLCRIASSYVGAELLLEDKILCVLSSMKVFDLHPDFELNTYNIQSQTSFVPPVDARYQQILFPALNLCHIIISTLGPENHSATTQMVNFLHSHGDMVELVLRSGSPYFHLGLLKELSGITGLIARSANQAFSVSIETNVPQDISSHLYRLQRLMLSLFSRFIVHETTVKEMVKPENITYESNDKKKAIHVKYFLEIASNLALYCRNAIANHSVDHRTTGILFSPNMMEPLHRNESKGAGYLEISPNLGIVVRQLKNTVEYYNRQKLIYDGLLRQKNSLPNISLDTSGRQQFLELSERLSEKQNVLCHCVFISEQCLYLLWTHLDFYMRRAIPANSFQIRNNSPFSIDGTEAGWKVASDEIYNLKKSLVSIFNETFCKQLISTTETQASSDKGFTEALLRRIKSLIQFVPVD